jgi:hypothetical protein
MAQLFTWKMRRRPSSIPGAASERVVRTNVNFKLGWLRVSHLRRRCDIRGLWRTAATNCNARNYAKGNGIRCDLSPLPTIVDAPNSVPK